MIKQILLALCGVCFMLDAQAKNYIGPTKIVSSKLQDITILGPATLEDVHVQTVSITGPLKFKNLTAVGQSTIAGPIDDSHHGTFATLMLTGLLKANHIVCDDLTVTGSIDVDDLQVKNCANCTGPLNAKSSSFNQLVVTADKIVLDDTQVCDILVKKNNEGSQLHCSNAQTLILKGTSKITGNITFESGEGLVVVEGQSVQIDGTVQGACVKK